MIKMSFESKIIVIDYISTMIFELISLNIPFVLILDNNPMNICQILEKNLLMI